MFARISVTLLFSLHSVIAAARPPVPALPRPPARMALGVMAVDVAPAQAPQGATPADQMVPDLTPPAVARDWDAEHRWLQAGTGVTWTLVGLGVIGMIIPLSMLSTCNRADSRADGSLDCSPERRVVGVTAPIIGVLTLASLVPAVLFTRRLAQHNKQRRTAQLHLAPGGLALRF